MSKREKARQPKPSFLHILKNVKSQWARVTEAGQSGFKVRKNSPRFRFPSGQIYSNCFVSRRLWTCEQILQRDQSQQCFSFVFMYPPRPRVFSLPVTGWHTASM